MVCSCAMLFSCVWLQMIFCSYVNKTTLSPSCHCSCMKNGRLLRFPKICKSIICLSFGKIIDLLATGKLLIIFLTFEDNMLFSHVKISRFPCNSAGISLEVTVFIKKRSLFNQNQINDLFVFAIIKASLKHSIHNGLKPRINGDILIWFLYFKDSFFSVRINALGCENTKMIQ